jgi:hypothetical protein|tara:strand:+ start:11132 stop:11302 length:171 start_codon:yes stop_codon:yes gene_type:complete
MSWFGDFAKHRRTIKEQNKQIEKLEDSVQHHKRLYFKMKEKHDKLLAALKAALEDA